MNAQATISAQLLADRIQRQDIDLIDVRTPAEFQEAHIECARNVPLTTLDPEQLMRGRGPEQPLYVICQAGSRGATACRKILEAGYDHVINVEGGTQAWTAVGLPVVRGKRNAISLERQVRIAAGLLIVLGAALGYFWNVNFVGLSAFVGAGLVYAGVTDRCGMALLLARMPWNGPAQSSCCPPERTGNAQMQEVGR
jgi:rhodanese-related sulfurtransferase